MRALLRHLPALSALAALSCWVIACFVSVSLETRTVSAGLHDGSAFWTRYAPEIVDRRARGPIPLLFLSRAGASPTGGPFHARPLWPFWLKSSTGTLYFVLPMWIVATLACLPLLPLAVRHARAWYRTRYTRLCPKCGYDLGGLPPGAASCPECGAAVGSRR